MSLLQPRILSGLCAGRKMIILIWIWWPVFCRKKPQERLGSGVGGFNMIRRHKWFKDFNWKGRILISLMNYFHLIQFFQIFAPRHSPPPSTQSSPVTLTPPALTASPQTYPAPLALHQGTTAMRLAMWSLEMNRMKEWRLILDIWITGTFERTITRLRMNGYTWFEEFIYLVYNSLYYKIMINIQYWEQSQ